MSKCEFNMIAHSSVLSHRELSNAAKLLYVWICSKRVDAEHKSVSWGENDQDAGFCQKTNEFFADKMGKKKTYISRLLSELETAKFIYIKRKNINGCTHRRIWCTPETCIMDEKATCTIGKSDKSAFTYRSKGVDSEVNARLPIDQSYIEEDYQKDYQEDVVKVATTSDEVQVEAETDGYILASALLALIRKNKKFYSRIAKHFTPEKEEKSLRRWAKDFDLLLTRDARDYDEAVEVLKWCQKDEFWQGQILSGGKFRKQFETLKNQMDGGSCGRFREPDDHPEITEKIIAAYGWLINNSQWKPHKGQMPKFIEAAERVIAFIDLHNDRGLTVDELIGYLKSALQEAYREKGEMVHPGNMKSDYTWDVIMPQYLETVIGAL
jgi:hypothetical protein